MCIIKNQPGTAPTMFEKIFCGRASRFDIAYTFSCYSINHFTDDLKKQYLQMECEGFSRMQVAISVNQSDPSIAVTEGKRSKALQIKVYCQVSWHILGVEMFLKCISRR